METADCKLCLSKSVDLRASHFLPRSFYALMRMDDHTPVYISKESMYSSTKQVKDYVFCGDCEQCFGKAETWIKPMLPEVGGPFSLRERLMKQAPIDKTADRELYKTASNPEIDVDKLTHFGIGVFYKGAVHPWNNGTPESFLKLAPEAVEREVPVDIHSRENCCRDETCGCAERRCHQVSTEPVHIVLVRRLQLWRGAHGGSPFLRSMRLLPLCAGGLSAVLTP
jgi:hypothetical protein